MNTSVIKPYVYRDSREAWLPSEIRDLIDEPAHISQGQTVVFAVSPQAAWKRLKNLGLEHRQCGHRLEEAQDVMSQAIATASVAGLVEDNVVFIFASRGGRKAVARIARDERDRRACEVVGHLEPWMGRYRWDPPNGDDDDEVTDDMVDAFCESIWDEPATEYNRENVRVAIAAALKARHMT